MYQTDLKAPKYKESPFVTNIMYYIYLFNILIKVALPWEKFLRPSLLVSRIHCLLKRLSLYPKLKKFLLKCEEKIKSCISLFIVFIYLFIFPFLYLSLHTHFHICICNHIISLWTKLITFSAHILVYTFSIPIITWFDVIYTSIHFFFFFLETNWNNFH